MKYLKNRDIKIISVIAILYCFKVIYLLNQNNRNNTDWGFLFVSFLFLCGGTLGLLNKFNPFFYDMHGGPKPIRKITYDDDDDLLRSIMGRLGNILAIIIGIVALFSDF